MKAQFVGWTQSSITAGTTMYEPFITQQSSNSWNSSLTAAEEIPLPHAITLDRLIVQVDVGPGTGKNLVFTVLKNGSATALTATISGSSTQSSDVTHTVSFAQGDQITIQVALDSGGTVPGTIYWNARQDASGMFAMLGAITSSSTGYLPVMGSGTPLAVGDAEVIVPCGGTVENLFVNSSGTAGNWTVYKNTVAQTLATGAMGGTTANDTTHSFTVVAGDRIAIRNTGTGRVTSWGISFAPTTDGQSFLTAVTNGNVSTSATTYIPATQVSGSPATSESSAMLQAATLLAVYGQTSVSPGVSPKQYTLQARQNSGNVSGASFVIQDSSSTPNDGSSGRANNVTGLTATINDYDLFDTSVTPSSTPIGLHAYVSMLISMTSGAAESQTTTTISRIQILATALQTTKSRIQAALTATTATKSRIQVLKTATTTTLSRIQNTTLTATTATKSRIQKSLSTTTTTISRISKSFTATTATKSRIAILGSATTTTLSRIQNTTLTALQTTKARIQNTLQQTTSTKSRIQKSFTTTTATLSRISKSFTQTTATKSRIQAALSATTHTLSRIQNSFTSTTSTKSRIQNTLTATTSTISRIAASTAHTATTTTVSRIQNTLSVTTATLSRIQKSFTATTSTKSRVQKAFSATTATIARIQKSLATTTSTKSRISKSFTATQPTKTRVQILGGSLTFTRSRVQKSLTAVTHTLSRISATFSATTQTQSRIQAQLTATTSTISRIVPKVILSPTPPVFSTQDPGTIELTDDSITVNMSADPTDIYL